MQHFQYFIYKRHQSSEFGLNTRTEFGLLRHELGPMNSCCKPYDGTKKRKQKNEVNEASHVGTNLFCLGEIR